MTASARTLPVMAAIGVSDRAVEVCTRPSEDAATGADGDGLGEGAAVGASVSTVPVALTLPVTSCQVTVLASVFVEAPGVVICPSFEASTMTELCAIRVTDSMDATASGVAKPSRRRVDVDSKWKTPPSSTETTSAPPSSRSHVKRHPSTPSTVTRREDVALAAVPID
jgi:hypothetical protein